MRFRLEDIAWAMTNGYNPIVEEAKRPEEARIYQYLFDVQQEQQAQPINYGSLNRLIALVGAKKRRQFDGNTS